MILTGAFGVTIRAASVAAGDAFAVPSVDAVVAPSE